MGDTGSESACANVQRSITKSLFSLSSGLCLVLLTKTITHPPGAPTAKHRRPSAGFQTALERLRRREVYHESASR